MTLTFDANNDASGLQAAIAYGREQGSITVDDNWSEIQKKAFAALSSSLGFSDPEHDGSYKYDGVTKTEVTPEALQMATNEAANDLVAKGAEEAQQHADSVARLDGVVDTAAHANSLAGVPTLGDPSGLVEPAFQNAKADTHSKLLSAVQKAPEAAQAGVEVVKAAAKKTHDAATSLEDAGYKLKPEAGTLLAQADQSSTHASEHAANIQKKVETQFITGDDELKTVMDQAFQKAFEFAARQVIDTLNQMSAALKKIQES